MTNQEIVALINKSLATEKIENLTQTKKIPKTSNFLLNSNNFTAFCTEKYIYIRAEKNILYKSKILDK